MSNETKQTAVDWQFEQLFNSFESFINKGLTLDEYFSHNLKVREQAKEMEYKQMIEFGAKCIESQNETYGGNK
jgi:hypothetical protein